MDRIDLTDKTVLVEFATAIVLHENGPPLLDKPEGWYDTALYEQAAALVLPLTV